LKNYSVVILCKDNRVSHEDEAEWITPELTLALTEFVENGGGLVVFHAGFVHPAVNPELKRLCGGSFIHHPEQCAVHHEIIGAHEITKNAENFSFTDEHYFIDTTDDIGEVFLESVSEHGRQVAGYARDFGKGKVVGLTPGHNLEGVRNPNYQKIICSAVKYAAS
jgi:type 1 glutamine amidotransferase